MDKISPPDSEHPIVSIVSVNWKAADETCQCVESLTKLENNKWYLTICENGSNDHSEHTLRTYLSKLFHEKIRTNNQSTPIFDYFCPVKKRIVVTLVISKLNLGFAGGCNLAKRSILSGINSQYFWYLNNDTLVDPKSLDTLIAKMVSNPKIGICGATILYEGNRNRVQVYGGARYFAIFAHVKEIGQGQSWPPSAIDENKIENQLDYVSGASMFIRSEFIADVGEISEEYFLYFEEIDWALRGKQKGYTLGYASNAIIYHKEGFVLGSGKSRNRSKIAQQYSSRGRVRITLKFYPLAIFTVYIFSFLQIIKLTLQGKSENSLIVFQSLIGKEPDTP